MAILGIRRLTYGVDALDQCIQFFSDYGLAKLEADERSALFETRNGAQVELLTLDHPSLPVSALAGIGVHQCTWAVDSDESLQRLVKNLKRDHEIGENPSGGVRFVTHFGQSIGLEVFTPRRMSCAPSPFNAPGLINRLNEPRKWIDRPVPKTINHTVWVYPDVNQAFDFYRDRLNFRLTDVQKGFGVYVRADGAYEHHNIFIADGHAIFPQYDGKLRFQHANFGLEDIDEIMVGKNFLERRGYNLEGWGLGRHRISSEAFLYVPCPAGGDAEYGADGDALDDCWRPRIWEAAFGTAIYVHNLPDWLSHQPSWDVGYVTPQTARHFSKSELRDGQPIL
jgi:catechol 2,3-dioxygenase-like lactoylglutathione lyase family enzyme